MWLSPTLRHSQVPTPRPSNRRACLARPPTGLRRSLMCESTIEFDAISAGNLSSVHVPLNGFPPFSHFGESGCSVTSSSRFSSTSGERRQGMQRACRLSLALGGWTGRRRAERAVNGTGGLQAARSLRYMAAVFERPPFRRCIKCSDRIGLGFLSAGGMTVHFRCRSCGFSIVSRCQMSTRR